MRGAVAGGGGTLAVGGTVSALAAVGAPWWAIAVVTIAFLIAGTMVVLANTFIPQDSQDKLEWWRDRRTHRTRNLRRRPITRGS